MNFTPVIFKVGKELRVHQKCLSYIQISTDGTSVSGLWMCLGQILNVVSDN